MLSFPLMMAPRIPFFLSSREIYRLKKAWRKDISLIRKSRQSKFSGESVKGAITDKGTIQTDTVVNAAGSWGCFIGEMVGLEKGAHYPLSTGNVGYSAVTALHIPSDNGCFVYGGGRYRQNGRVGMRSHHKPAGRRKSANRSELAGCRIRQKDDSRGNRTHGKRKCPRDAYAEKRSSHSFLC